MNINELKEKQENTAGCAVCGTRDFVTGTGEQRLCYSCWQTHGEENTPALEPHRDSLTMFKVGDRVHHQDFGDGTVLGISADNKAAYLRLDCSTNQWLRMSMLTLSEEPAPALEPLDFVAQRDAMIRHKTPGGADRERRPGPGCRIYFGPHDDSDFAWSLRFYGAESSVCAADVPRVYEELCKLRDVAAPALEPLDFVAPRDAVVSCERCGFEHTIVAGKRVVAEVTNEGRALWVKTWYAPGGFDADQACCCMGKDRIHAELVALRDEADWAAGRETCLHMVGYIDVGGNEVCGQCQKVLRKSGDEPRVVSVEAERLEKLSDGSYVYTFPVPAFARGHNLTIRLDDYRGDMVSAVVSAQVRAGGVDTPGTRAEAERYCAYLCECVQKGMMATTDDSAYRVYHHRWTEKLSPRDMPMMERGLRLEHGVIIDLDREACTITLEQPEPTGTPLGKP